MYSSQPSLVCHPLLVFSSAICHPKGHSYNSPDVARGLQSTAKLAN